MESRALLSGVTAQALGHLSSAFVAPSPKPARLTVIDATTKGTYTLAQSNPDTGKVYSFFQAGTLKGVGAVTVTGSITTPGNIRFGRAHGTLAAHSVNGTLTLDVTGPAQRGGSALPTTLTFTVTHGTGAFSGVHGKGTIVVALHQTYGTPAPRYTAGGTATMAFHGAGA